MSVLRASLPLLVLGLVAFATPAQADVDLTTLPSREHVQLTIYNTADLTLAREQRILTFKKGLNRIQFSWANTLIDPTSLQLRILEHDDKIVLEDTTFPANRRQALQWNVVSEVAGPVLVELSYFTSGLTWKAEYSGIANHAETEMTFRGYVRVFNSSGEDYEQANTRLMVGTVHLIERIADLANGRFRTFTRPQRDAAIRHFLDAESRYRRMTGGGRAVEYEKAKGVAKDGLSEYFIFSIAGQETVRNRWSKRLQAVFAERVPIETYYRLSEVTTGGKVTKFYKFANRKVGKGALGSCPLPGGKVRIFTRRPDGDLSYVGAQTSRYVPMGDRVLLNLGVDDDLVVQRQLRDYRRTDIRLDGSGRVRSYREHSDWETRIHNTKDKKVRLEIERRIPRNHQVSGVSGFEAFERVDNNVRKYYVDLKPNEVRIVKYRVSVNR